MRRGQIVSLVGIGVLAGGIATAVAVLLPWLPRPAAREASRIDFTIWFVIVICIVIFAIVAAAILYSVVRFRARPDDHEDGPPIHGHTGLEITWTLIPMLLVTAIAIVSAIVLARDGAQGKNVLRVNVTAQQFAWSFSYPDAKGLTTGSLMLPKGRSVLLRFTSKDVIHSFWVPEFGQKQDTVPGMHPTLHITPDRLGTFPVICTELCGLGHALMRAQAVVITPAAFAKWLKSQSAAISSPNAAVSGAAVFKNNACGACHTLAAAGASGKVGPDLDKLAAYAKQARQPLESFIRESIVSPNAYIQPGYPKNVMPQTFGKSLSKPQLDSLVKYLAVSGTKG
ncbi:MAG: cytochrome c oxidase subunit II [Gaiellaceae bacterium]|jgi:cytochrome c oxidase subunit 2